MTHPDADPELLRAVLNEMEPVEEFTIEDIEEMQGAYDDSPMVRPSFPKIINVEREVGESD